MRKSIVFFIQNFSRAGGSERVCSIIANLLARNGYDIKVVSICGNNQCFYDLDERVKLITLFSREKLDNKRYFFTVLKKMYKFFKTNDVDVCIDVFPSLSIYTNILKRIFYFKNITWEHYNYNVDIGMSKFGRRMAILFSDKIITLTNADMQDYIENNKNTFFDIDYIHNPSPFVNYDNDFETRERILLSVGRLSYEKGFDRMVCVWEKIEDRTDWDLIIVGDGEELDNLKELIKNKNLKRIHLVSTTKNISEYYKKASIYISTSRFEGMPMTMIEAQTFGVPIVTYNFKNGPNEIINEGIDGYIIDGKDEQDRILKMSEKILFLMNNGSHRKKMSEFALCNSSRFTVSNIEKNGLE